MRPATSFTVTLRPVALAIDCSTRSASSLSERSRNDHAELPDRSSHDLFLCKPSEPIAIMLEAASACRTLLSISSRSGPDGIYEALSRVSRANSVNRSRKETVCLIQRRCVIIPHVRRRERNSFTDWIIDIGPGAGDEGGRIVASGAPEQVASNLRSVTARYLAAT